jgi:hypothetical protein
MPKDTAFDRDRLDREAARRETGGKSRSIIDSLPIVEGRPGDPAMTFRREDIYGPDAAR